MALRPTNVTHFSTSMDLLSNRTCGPYFSWEFKSLCLETSFFPDDHTGELIEEGLPDALMSRNSSETCQVCITTDAEANLIKAGSLNDWTRVVFGPQAAAHLSSIRVGLPSSNVWPGHSRVSCTNRTRATGKKKKGFFKKGNNELCQITQRQELSALQSLSADSKSDPLQWWQDHDDFPIGTGIPQKRGCGHMSPGLTQARSRWRACFYLWLLTLVPSGVTLLSTRHSHSMDYHDANFAFPKIDHWRFTNANKHRKRTLIYIVLKCLSQRFLLDALFCSLERCLS